MISTNHHLARSALEGTKPLLPASVIIEQPELALAQSNVTPYSDLMVTVQLFADSKPLTTPVSTSYRAFSFVRRWNEWLTLPIKFSELPATAQLAITVWDSAGPNKYVPYGGTTVTLLDSTDACLKRGRQKLKLWLDRPADGNANSTTDARILNNHEMDRLENVLRKHSSATLSDSVLFSSTSAWLDNLAFRKLEQINKALSAADPSDHFLYIDFVQFDVPIVYAEPVYPPPPMFPVLQQYAYLDPDDDIKQQQQPAPARRRPVIPASITTGIVNEVYNDYHPTQETGPVVQVVDPDQFRENPIDRKYRRLIRGAERGLFDKDLKPNAKTRDDLQRLITASSPVYELSDDDKNLLWKFRYYLTRHSQALTKFLRSIAWEDPAEAKQAVEMLPRWAEIGIDDALELLGPNFSNAQVRAHAVDRLRKASDHELELYLLQLVQALRFEKGTSSSSLGKFLIGRAARNPILGNYFFWYVNVEALETGAPQIFKTVLGQFKHSLKQASNGGASGSLGSPNSHATTTSGSKHNSTSADSGDHDHPPPKTRLQILELQINLVNKLLKIANEVKTLKEPRPKKIEKLQSFLADARNGLLNFDPIPLPLDPSVTITGTIPNDCNVFKSSLSPLKITFKTQTAAGTPGPQYSIIFKAGDDLRQDQLVIQIITLMDQLLRNENLDLKLTPYRILATGPRDGALQFVPNETLAAVLSDYPGGILGYLQHHNPDSTNALGVSPRAMDTYIRSCAGYCVITYLLGVGDRHLDNLLICPDGHFFHADFGYILGHDPKPFPPMMKLPIQIIDGMGGVQHENYDRFRSLCFTTYTTLRKSADLILNLFTLMSHSTIPDIAMEGGLGAVWKVREKFGGVEMSEEEAIVHFQNLINESVNAFLPMVIDRLHNLAQYWRA